jgi:hypothetical protein
LRYPTLCAMTMGQCLYLNAIWSYHATHFLSSTSGCCVFYIISPKELPLAHHILLERVSKIKYHVPQHNSTALHLPHREVHAHHRIQDSNSTILYSPSYIHHLIFTILYSPSYVHHLVFSIKSKLLNSEQGNSSGKGYFWVGTEVRHAYTRLLILLLQSAAPHAAFYFELEGLLHLCLCLCLCVALDFRLRSGEDCASSLLLLCDCVICEKMR